MRAGFSPGGTYGTYTNPGFLVPVSPRAPRASAMAEEEEGEMQAELREALARERKLLNEMQRMREHVLELEGESDAGEQQSEELKHKLAHAHSRIDALSSERDTALAQLEECQSELSNLRNLLSTHKAEKSARERAELELLQLRDRVTSLSSERDDALSERDRLRSSLAAEQSTRSEIERALDSKEEERATLADECAHLRSVFPEHKQMHPPGAQGSSDDLIQKSIAASILRQYLTSSNRQRASEILELLAKTLCMSDEERKALIPSSRGRLRKLVNAPVRFAAKASSIVADKSMQPTADHSDVERRQDDGNAEHPTLGDLWVEFLMSKLDEEEHEKADGNGNGRVETAGLPNVKALSQEAGEARSKDHRKS